MIGIETPFVEGARHLKKKQNGLTSSQVHVVFTDTGSSKVLDLKIPDDEIKRTFEKLGTVTSLKRLEEEKKIVIEFGDPCSAVMACQAYNGKPLMLQGQSVTISVTMPGNPAERPPCAESSNPGRYMGFGSVKVNGTNGPGNIMRKNSGFNYGNASSSPFDRETFSNGDNSLRNIITSSGTKLGQQQNGHPNEYYLNLALKHSNSYNKSQSRGSMSSQTVSSKFTCRYDIQIENDKEFQVAKRIIGPKVGESFPSIQNPLIYHNFMQKKGLQHEKNHCEPQS